MSFTGKSKGIKRALIYTRVSTEEQAIHGNSLRHQEEILRLSCHRDSVEVIKHFQDDGYSAKDFKRRPAFKEMCEYIHLHPKIIDYIYIARWDRFSRNMTQTYVEIDRLEKLGIQVKCLEETVSHRDPAFPYVRSIKIAEGQSDNMRRALNTTTGIVRARKDGRYTGPPPKGYKRERSSNGKTIIVPDESARLIKEAFETAALGLYSIDTIRKKLFEKGLKIGRSAFYCLLRNKTYMGLTKVLEFNEEEEYYVPGLHEPLVSEDLFLQVQSVLKKLDEKSCIPTIKVKQREEFPLRGLLICHECNRNLTGSLSKSRNGNYYGYYHCQNTCKTRFSAEFLNDRLEEFLKSITIPTEISELYIAILEDTFKSNEGDRKVQIQGLKERINDQKAKIEPCDDMLLNREIDRETHQRMIPKLKEEIAILRKKIELQESSETGFMRYCRFGIPLLSNLSGFYMNASIEIKQKLLGSIFPAKLHFREDSYRTTPLNPALALILQKNKVLKNEKTGQILFEESLSGELPMAGLEPAPCCQE
jgi:site-specific DNA recombinase